MTDNSSADDTVVRLEFRLSDPQYPFVAASERESCTLLLERFLPRGEGTYAEFYTLRDGDPSAVVEAAETFEGADGRVLETADDRGLVELTAGETCPVVSLAAADALPQTVVADDGEGRIVADVPASTEPTTVVESFQDSHPSGELASKCQRDSLASLLTAREYAHLDQRLTDRQLEVLEAAQEAGYYEWPREITGGELADSLDIASSTLHKHLRAAERKFVGALFERRIDE